jgi:competence protein ComGF
MNIRNYFDINSLKRKRDDNDRESDVKTHNKRNKLVHDKFRKDEQNRSQSSATNKNKSIVCKTCGKGHQGICMHIKEMNANPTNHEWLNSPAHIWFRD